MLTRRELPASWRGDLGFDALPLLEWFGTTEAQAAQLERLCERARPQLHHLALGRYRFADLRLLLRSIKLEARIPPSPVPLAGLSSLEYL